MSESFKFCAGCNKELSDSCFDVYKTRSGFLRVRSRCRKCCLAQNALRKKRIGHTTRASYKLIHNYGLKKCQFDMILKSQNNCCVICKRSFEEQQVNVDHCHTTGIIRGLLCSQCNRGLGFFQDSSEILKLAAAYLERKKT